MYMYMIQVKGSFRSFFNLVYFFYTTGRLIIRKLKFKHLPCLAVSESPPPLSTILSYPTICYYPPLSSII